MVPLLIFVWFIYWVFFSTKERDQYLSEKNEEMNQRCRELYKTVKGHIVFHFIICLLYTTLLLQFPFHTFISSCILAIIYLIKMIRN